MQEGMQGVRQNEVGGAEVTPGGNPQRAALRDHRDIDLRALLQALPTRTDIESLPTHSDIESMLARLEAIHRQEWNQVCTEV